MTVAIIGGGIMGISLGYFLSQQGVEVEIFEASPVLGGLAGPIILDDGTAVDRFYHAILSSDSPSAAALQRPGHRRSAALSRNRDGLLLRRRHLLDEQHGRVPALPAAGLDRSLPPGLDGAQCAVRARLARAGRGQRAGLAGALERPTDVSRTSGGRCCKAKFDGNFADAPATYIWSRLVRMKSTRSGANQKEEAGHLIGGYLTLIKAMAAKIEAPGGRNHLRCPMQEIVIEGDTATGVLCEGHLRPFDAVVATVQAPVFRRLIPGASAEYLDYCSTRV